MASGYEWHGKTDGSGAWEEVLAPIDCSYYQISDSASAGFAKCSDTDDAQTCRAFTSGFTFAIIAPPSGHSYGVRWKKGEHITYVKSSAPLDLYFLK